MKPLRLALIQMASGPDPDANMARVAAWISACPEVDLIALPEVFAVRCARERVREWAEPLTGPMLGRLQALAQEKKTWILAGSMLEANASARPCNTSVLIDRGGRAAAVYRKIHLFEACLDDGTRIREADVYTPGTHPVMAEMESWKAGLSICFDVRFPDLYGGYAQQGADLLFVPSDFTRETGRAHWEPLLRARAIENRCFVVAPNQCGTHPGTGVTSYGRSMAVGPWGDILCQSSETGEGPSFATLDPADLIRARARLP